MSKAAFWVTNFTLQGGGPLLLIFDNIKTTTCYEFNQALNKGFGIPMCNQIVFAAVFSSDYPPNDTAFVLRGDQTLDRVLDTLIITQGSLLEKYSMEQVWPLQVTLPSKEDEQSISDPVAVKLVKELRKRTVLAKESRYATYITSESRKNTCWDIPVFSKNRHWETVKGKFLDQKEDIEATPVHVDILLRFMSRKAEIDPPTWKILESQWTKMKDRVKHIQSHAVIQLPIACPDPEAQSMEEKKLEFFKIFSTPRKGSDTEDDEASEEDKTQKAFEEKKRLVFSNCARDTFEKLSQKMHFEKHGITALDVQRHYLVAASNLVDDTEESFGKGLELALNTLLIERELKEEKVFEKLLKDEMNQPKKLSKNEAARKLTLTWNQWLQQQPADLDKNLKRLAVIQKIINSIKN